MSEHDRYQSSDRVGYRLVGKGICSLMGEWRSYQGHRVEMGFQHFLDSVLSVASQ